MSKVGRSLDSTEELNIVRYSRLSLDKHQSQIIHLVYQNFHTCQDRSSSHHNQCDFPVLDETHDEARSKVRDALDEESDLPAQAPTQGLYICRIRTVGSAENGTRKRREEGIDWTDDAENVLASHGSYTRTRTRT